MLKDEKYLLVGINNKQRIKKIWLIGMTNTSISDLFYFASCATRRNVYVYQKCCALLGKYGTGCSSFRSMKWCCSSVCLSLCLQVTAHMLPKSRSGSYFLNYSRLELKRLLHNCCVLVKIIAWPWHNMHTWRKILYGQYLSIFHTPSV